MTGQTAPEEITLQTDKSSATFVPAYGANCASLCIEINGETRELLYQHPHFYDSNTDKTRGGIPFLFPMCGRLERDGEEGVYLLGSTRYTMKIHGFIHRMPWQVDSVDETSITMSCRDDEDTFAVYPFHFVLRITYTLDSTSLVCHFTVENTGKVPFPYYAGFHPFFSTPEPGKGKEKVKITMSPHKNILYNDRLTDITGVREFNPFPTSITNEEINECLFDMGSEAKAAVTFPDGYSLEITAGGDDAELFPYMQLYTMPDRPFFCIEPWMGMPNALNSVAGVRWLSAGVSESGWFTVHVK